MTKILIKKETGSGLIGCYEGNKEALKNMLGELLVGDDDFFAIAAAAFNESVEFRTKNNRLLS